ncbi:MAG TPA: DUF373 family protein, partial [Natrialbaceae archaeon]|nr:DUF373 family protein [Natrialbaceae archaeon]
VLGLASGVMGLYVLSRGIGLGSRVNAFVDRARNVLYAGRATVITYVVAVALLIIGGVSGVEYLQATQADVAGTLGGIEALAALLFGSVRWFAAAAITTSVGQITDEYLADRLEWRYLNAPFYVLAIAGVLHTLSAYLLEIVVLSTLAAVLTGATLLALASTLAFAIAESKYPRAEPV